MYRKENLEEAVPIYKEKVDKSDVKLVSGKEANYWHIFHLDCRAGYVVIKNEKNKKKPFITVMLNKKSQGKGIGTIAFQLACEGSGYTVVYANISKKNTASLIAAERAGFKIDITAPNGQLILKWRKKKK